MFRISAELQHTFWLSSLVPTNTAMLQVNHKDATTFPSFSTSPAASLDPTRLHKPRQHKLMRKAKEHFRVKQLAAAFQAWKKRAVCQQRARQAVALLCTQRKALVFDLWWQHTAKKNLIQASLSKAVAALCARRTRLAVEVWRQHTSHRRRLQAQAAQLLIRLRMQRLAQTFGGWRQRWEHQVSLRERLSQTTAALQTRRLRVGLAGWKSVATLTRAQKQKVNKPSLSLAAIRLTCQGCVSTM